MFLPIQFVVFVIDFLTSLNSKYKKLKVDESSLKHVRLAECAQSIPHRKETVILF